MDKPEILDNNWNWIVTGSTPGLVKRCELSKDRKRVLNCSEMKDNKYMVDQNYWSFH